MSILLSKTNKSTKLAAKLKEQIKNHGIAPGAKLMSTRELAETYGVAYLTADKALNILEKERLIIRNARSGSYARKATSDTRKLQIGFSGNDYIPNENIKNTSLIFQNHILTYLRDNNCEVTVLPQVDLCDFERIRHFDGMILGSFAINRPDMFPSLFETLNIPLVFCQLDYEYSYPINQVLPYMNSGMRELCQKINEHDYSDIILLYEDHENCRARRDCFITEAQAAGINVDNIEMIKTDYVMLSSNYTIYLELSKRCHNKFIFACTGLIALNLMTIFMQQGITPGIDVSLACCGYFDAKDVHQRGVPTLTNICFPYNKISEAASKLLLSLCHDKTMNQHIHKIKVKTKLAVGETAFSDCV